jgi:hypothetical protein
MMLVACAPELEYKERFVLDAGSGALAATLDAAPATLEPCPDVPTLLATSCATTSCHTTKDHVGGLDLELAPLPYRMFAAPAVGGVGMLIDPTAPERSVLYTKMTDTPPFGARMPMGVAPLDSKQMDCTRTWIANIARGTAGLPDAAIADGE